MSDSHPFRMTISLDVLEHLGIGLYSNIPAVLSELVANAWDADATAVEITLDRDAPSITIRDNGHGMSHEDVNAKFLTVGYRRRTSSAKTPDGREAMGRKGIGKLAAFSIADTVEVHTTDGSSASAFRMDTDAIRASAADPKKPDYFPDPLPSELAPIAVGDADPAHQPPQDADLDRTSSSPSARSTVQRDRTISTFSGFRGQYVDLRCRP